MRWDTFIESHDGDDDDDNDKLERQHNNVGPTRPGTHSDLPFRPTVGVIFSGGIPCILRNIPLDCSSSV